MSSLLFAIAFALAVFSGFAAARWLYWRGEYERLRRYHVEAMKDAQRPFVRALPPKQDNVIPVDFRGGDHAA